MDIEILEERLRYLKHTHEDEVSAAIEDLAECIEFINERLKKIEEKVA